MASTLHPISNIGTVADLDTPCCHGGQATPYKQYDSTEVSHLDERIQLHFNLLTN